MQAESDDRYTDQSREGRTYLLPAAIGALLVIAAITWFFSSGEPEQPAQAAAPTDAPTVQANPKPARPPAPDIPNVEPAASSAGDSAALESTTQPPPLTLAESDTAVRGTLSAASGNAVIASAISEENLLERSTAFFDAAGKGSVLRSVFPLPTLEGEFSVVEVDGRTVTDPQSYKRYDVYAQAVAAVDTGTLAAAFHRFRPLLEQAYAKLGYPAQDMDNALISALDEVIAAPRLQSPATLVAGVQEYSYQDPSLEELSPMAKQVLRMGPENQALVQQKALELRSALLSGEAPEQLPAD